MKSNIGDFGQNFSISILLYMLKVNLNTTKNSLQITIASHWHFGRKKGMQLSVYTVFITEKFTSFSVCVTDLYFGYSYLGFHTIIEILP